MHQFITNNLASFHLRCKENLVKHQKVSKYYDNDCRYRSESRKTYILRLASRVDYGFDQW